MFMGYKTPELRRVAARARYASDPEVRRRQREASDRYLAKKPRHILKDTRRGWSLDYRYKMTVEEYEHQLAEQGGRCALCSNTQADQKRRLCVDHNHACCPGQKSCGECLRGILCSWCNHKIGVLEQIALEGEIKATPGTWTATALTYLTKYQLQDSK